MAKVKLTWKEAHIAAKCGLARLITSMEKGHRDRAGRNNDWAAHIEGSCAEMAVAKYFKVTWHWKNQTFSLPDVGQIEVKLSRQIPELAVPEKIERGQIFMLVMGQVPEFEICGWITAEEAIEVEPSIKKYYPARWIPKDKLHKPSVKLLREKAKEPK